MGALTLQTTAIDGVFIVSSAGRLDGRGSFMRLYCEQELAPALQGRHIVQANHSLTRAAGVVRGLHFQRPPYSELKMVRCLRGRVWDVAVDLRAGSPTFLRWFAQELSGEGGQMMVIPEGCAHGFQALEPDSELLYLHTCAYEPSAEAAIRWDEPRVGIHWPLEVKSLSPRDLSHPYLAPEFEGVRV